MKTLNTSFIVSVIILANYITVIAKVDPSFLPDTTLWDSQGVTLDYAEYVCYQPHWIINAVWNGSSYTINPVHKKIYRLNNYNEVDDSTWINYSIRGGDRLMTKILDIRNTAYPYLTFLYQRAGITGGTNTGRWDSQMFGPEIRVVEKAQPDSVVREADELLVEFASVDSAHLSELNNPDESLWNVHPRRNGDPSVTGNPALSIFGGGGYRTGFSETDRDSALTFSEGLRMDVYDAGFDDRFERAYIHIPEQFRKNGFLRIRFRVDAAMNGDVSVLDDRDDFFLDDIHVVDIAQPDIALNSIYFQNPYSILNYNSKYEIPLYANISKMLPVAGDSFNLRIRIKTKSQDRWPLLPDETGYSGEEGYAKILTFSADSSNNIIQLPPLKIASFKRENLLPATIFQVWACIEPSGSNNDMANDSIFVEFAVNFDNVIAYDSPNSVSNYSDFKGTPGTGLNLFGFSSGLDLVDVEQNINSGRIAVRFEFPNTDTIYGYQAYWGGNNPIADAVELALLKEGGQPGVTMVSGSRLLTKRGYDTLRNGIFFNEYVTYLLPEPLILGPGAYYLTAAQISQQGFQLGASVYRMGMVTTSTYSTNDQNKGLYSYNQLVDKSMKKIINIQLNQNKFVNFGTLFAYENTYGSGNWSQFTPINGNPAYGHLDYYGNSKGYNTYTRGSFVPMLRLYMDGSHSPWSSVTESKVDKNTIISPNPASDYITIIVPSDDHTLKGVVEDVRLFDVFGQEVSDGLHLEGGIHLAPNVRIDVSALPAGVYFVRVGEKVSKFIKI